MSSAIAMVSHCSSSMASKIFLKEVRLPLSLLIQNISKVVSVSDQLLQILILLR